MKNFIVSEHLEINRDEYTFESQCEYNTEYFHIGLFQEYDIKLPRLIIHASYKRQAEFLAGRYAAKNALNAMGIRCCQVPISKNRSPSWPSGVIGSITHSNQIALSIVGCQNNISNIGVDIEPWFTPDVAREISSEILMPTEHSILKALDYPFERLLTICFSAKESVYKAISFENKPIDNFKQLEVVGFTLGKRGTITICLSEALTENSFIKDEFICDYLIHENETITRLIHRSDRI